MKSTTHKKQPCSNKIIQICKQQFARHGIPDILVTDNGPQFASTQFRDFAMEFQFVHTTSSPHYPQSNGRAEKAVQTIKNLIKKATEEKQDLYTALLDLRNTPTDSVTGSPAQRLMGRRTKTLIPTTKQLLTPKTINPQKVTSMLTEKKSVQKHYYDRNAKPQPKLKSGDKVMIRKEGTWTQATVTENLQEPRSYYVKTPQGQIFRRNRRHLGRAPDQQIPGPADLSSGTDIRQSETHTNSSSN